MILNMTLNINMTWKIKKKLPCVLLSGPENHISVGNFAN